MNPTPARWYPPAVPAHQAPPAYHTAINPLTGELVTLTAAEIEARRHADRILYARRIHRQAELADRDRRTRHAVLVFLAAVTAAVLALLILGGILLYRAITSPEAGQIGGIALGMLGVLALAGLAGGTKCVTTIIHRH